MNQKELLNALFYKTETFEQFQNLIDKGLDINGRDPDFLGLTPLMKAKSSAIAEWLIKAGADVNAKDDFGNTPLMMAKFEPEVVEVLIKYGADVNTQNGIGETALMEARDPEVIEILINAGANVNITDNDGKTALMKAINPKAIETLINAGADVNIENNNKENALTFIEELLIEKYEELQIIQEHVKKYEELKGIILQKMKK